MRAWPALAALLIAIISALAGGAPASAAREAKRNVVVVPCSAAAGSSASGTSGGNRVVLDVVSAPPARIERAQTDPSASPWTHFAKWGLDVHIGSTPVEVSVPDAWRRRLAITWGSGIGVVTSLRIASCQRPAGPRGSWNGYPGGFLLRSATACVPLTVTVGRRSRTLRVGIGESCSKR